VLKWFNPFIAIEFYIILEREDKMFVRFKMIWDSNSKSSLGGDCEASLSGSLAMTRGSVIAGMDIGFQQRRKGKRRI